MKWFALSLFMLIGLSGCDNDETDNLSFPISFEVSVLETMPGCQYTLEATCSEAVRDLAVEIEDEQIARVGTTSSGIYAMGGLKRGQTTCYIHSRTNPKDQTTITIKNRSLHGLYTLAVCENIEDLTSVTADDLTVTNTIRNELIEAAQKSFGTIYSFNATGFEEKIIPCRIYGNGNWRSATYDYAPDKLVLHDRGRTKSYVLTPLGGNSSRGFNMMMNYTEHYQKLYPQANIQSVSQTRILLAGAAVLE